LSPSLSVDEAVAACVAPVVPAAGAGGWLIRTAEWACADPIEETDMENPSVVLTCQRGLPGDHAIKKITKT
jgi:hypothetical protein